MSNGKVLKRIHNKHVELDKLKAENKRLRKELEKAKYELEIHRMHREWIKENI